MPTQGPAADRRRVLLTGLSASAIAAASLAPRAARAQEFPSRPLKFVVNFPPGGPLDVVARQMAARLTETLKQTVVVENQGGAVGTIGASAVARAQPDGHTVLFSIDAPLTVTPVLNPELPFKPEELRPVTLLGTTASTLVVSLASGITSLADLIARGKRDAVPFATAGIGSPGHFGAAMFAEAAGIKINPIHYKGNAPAVTALLGGEVVAGVLGSGGVAPHVAAGKLRALAVAGPNRSLIMPDVPTASEQGLQGMDQLTGFLVMVPLRTPDAVVNTLRDALVEATRQPAWNERMRALDTITTNLSPRDTAAWITSASQRYARIVKATGMKAE